MRSIGPGGATEPRDRTIIGIAVPSLNQARYLGEALSSLEAQGDAVQIAVVDGGSQDGSGAIIAQRAGRLAYWRSHPDRGQAAAINEGIARLPRAGYVGWLNADDLLLPGALSRMAEYLDQHPRSVAVAGRARLIDEGGRPIGEFRTRPFRRRRLARGSIVCQPASLIRREAWDAAGGLDESLHLCLDYDAWWRLSALGPIGYLPAVVACSRDHEATKSRLYQDRHYVEAFQVLGRHLGRVPLIWCLREAAYRWRRDHGGRRAQGLRDRAGVARNALVRYVRVNGVARRAGARVAPERDASGDG